jgi:hypothetical protein
MLPNYSRVRLMTDRFYQEDLKIGDIGYIIETYSDDAYEVEFSGAMGVTVGQIVVHGSELEVCEPVPVASDLPAKQ